MWKTWTGGPEASAVQSPQAGGGGGLSMPGGWHPTIIYLVVLLTAEILLAGFLTRRVLK